MIHMLSITNNLCYELYNHATDINVCTTLFAEFTKSYIMVIYIVFCVRKTW